MGNPTTTHDARSATWSALAVAFVVVLVTGATAAWALPSSTPDGTDSTDGFVYGIARSNDTIYIGGSFTQVGGQPRSNLAAIDATTGQVTAWNPGANRDVRTVAVAANGSIYVGGKFSRIDGQRRVKVARFSPAGDLDPWKPKVRKGMVLGITPAGSRVYVGGRFGEVNGVARPYLVALDAVTGDVLPWDPRADGQVWDVELDADGDVWVAGKYRAMGGQLRRGLAELDPTTADATAFAPSIRIPAYDLALNPGRVYVAGGGPGGRVITYALDSTSGALLWEAQADGDIQAVDATPTTVYAGGHQTVVEGQTRKGVAAFDAETGALLDWAVRTNGGKGPYRIVITGDALLVGGQFHTVEGLARGGFARFPGTP